MDVDYRCTYKLRLKPFTYVNSYKYGGRVNVLGNIFIMQHKCEFVLVDIMLVNGSLLV